MHFVLLPLVFVLCSPHLPSYPLSLLKRSLLILYTMKATLFCTFICQVLFSSQWYHFVQLANSLTAFYQAVSRNNTGLKNIIQFFLSRDDLSKRPEQSLSSILYKRTDFFNKQLIHGKSRSSF